MAGSARRRLFDAGKGEGEADGLFDEVKGHLAGMKDGQRVRWNFDFDSEVPLPGAFQWEKVDNGNVEAKAGSNCDKSERCAPRKEFLTSCCDVSDRSRRRLCCVTSKNRRRTRCLDDGLLGEEADLSRTADSPGRGSRGQMSRPEVRRLRQFRSRELAGR